MNGGTELRPISVCGRMIKTVELDGDKTTKEIVVINSMCLRKVKEGSWYSAEYAKVSNVEIVKINPKTGKHEEKKVVYTLPEEGKFAQEAIAGLSGDLYSEPSDSAVIVEDMNNDGAQDIVINTADERIIVLYNDGKGNFQAK